jgi:hypothetical protein
MTAILPEPKVLPFLTMIANRAPMQKAHVSQGQAKKAVLNRIHRGKLSEPVKVYQWTNHGWDILWDLPEGMLRDELPWM